jgi:hypothetical protein
MLQKLSLAYLLELAVLAIFAVFFTLSTLRFFLAFDLSHLPPTPHRPKHSATIHNFSSDHLQNVDSTIRNASIEKS